MTLTTNADADPLYTVALSGAGTLPPASRPAPQLPKTLAVGESQTDVLIGNQSGRGEPGTVGSVRPAVFAVHGRRGREAADAANLLPAAAPNPLDRVGPAGNGRAGREGRRQLRRLPRRPARAWRPRIAQSMAAARSHSAWGSRRAALCLRRLDRLAAYFNSWKSTTSPPNTWSAGAPMPVVDRGFASATGTDGNVYLIGGCNSASYKYDPPHQRLVRHRLAPATGFLGGRGHRRRRRQDLRVRREPGRRPGQCRSQIYNPATNTWTLGAPMPTARIEPGAAKLPGGLIMVAGGAADPASS